MFSSHFWSEPTTKDAFRLSVVSIIITLLSAVAGLIFYGVRKRETVSSADFALRPYSFYFLTHCL
jgi:hypothetical protein